MNIEAIGVALPAHDEEEHIADALAALHDAACAVTTPVHLAVVIDDCNDRTGARARCLCMPRFASITIIDVAARNVGAARSAGMDALLAGLPAETTWLTTTDADTTVPSNWFAGHLRHAQGGADLVAGTVRLADTGPIAEYVRRAHDSRYRQVLGHDHVHGANLGVNGRVYRAIGGFPAAPSDEDVLLVGAARAAGYRVVGAPDVAVTTSTRLLGRAPFGLAHHLAGLAGVRPVDPTVA